MHIVTFILLVTIAWLISFFIILPVGVSYDNQDTTPTHHRFFLKLTGSLVFSIAVGGIIVWYAGSGIL